MITDTRANAMLDTEFSASDKMSLHSAYSATGTNELASGSYARQTITWSAAASRAKASSGNIDFSLAGADVAAWVGVWNSTGSVFRGMWPNGGTDYSYQVDLTNDKIYCENNNWANDQRVMVT